MGFDAFAKLKEAKSAIQDAGAQRAVELLADINTVLQVLPDAGYEVGELEVELGVTPKMTMNLRIGRAVNEDRLKEILAANQNNKMLAAVLSALMQAGKFQDAVSVETLELQNVKIILSTPPNVALQWKQKVAAATAAA
jgi:hypothetical protein